MEEISRFFSHRSTPPIFKGSTAKIYKFMVLDFNPNLSHFVKAQTF